MIEDYSIAFYPFMTVVASLVVALFVKLLEHVKKPKPKITKLDDSRGLPDLDRDVDEEPDDSLIYDELFHD